MKNPEDMTNAQVLNWLHKTSDSISSFRARGGTMNTQRGYELVDRYQELREVARYRNVWDTFCDAKGFASSHDGYDCFA